MASYSLPYHGPGYPDMTAVAAEANRGLAGLARMQTSAARVLEASVVEAISNRREARESELAAQSFFLESARQERLDNIQAARNYAALEQTMVVIGLKAFPAALVGGLDSLLGALVGALVIACAEVLLIYYVDPLLSDVVPFLVLIAMLIVRPWGLFGTREELDRV